MEHACCGLEDLRILPSEWNTHVVVWRNKPDLDSVSFDDLYKKFKIIEQEVKRTVTSSSNSSSQNMAIVTTPSNSTLDSTANLSDVTVYAFLANQLNGSQLVHEDLEQIHEDNIEEMDLKWQLDLLKCFNCHKMGHFARECRSPRNQESRARNQDNTRRTVNVEDISSKAMVAIDGAGFDWSYMTDEEVPTNLALMAFLDSEVHNTCSNTCLKSFETLKTQIDNLRVEFNKSEFNLATYKRGLASVKEQLVFYKKNEVMVCDQIDILKRDASFKDSEINALNIQIENFKKEKECNQIKIDNFENASKSLDKLIGSQISNKNRKGVGYNVVPPPPTGLFAPLTIDLSNSGLKEFQQPKFEGYGFKANKGVYWVSDCDEDESEVRILKSDNVQQKPKQANQPRKVSENPRNNRTNLNENKTQKLGVGFQFTKKACFVCGSFNHLIKDYDFHDKKMVQKPVLNNVKKGTGQREVRPVWNNSMRVNHQNFSNSRKNFVPTAVLTKSGIVSVSAVRPINTAAPKSFVNAAKTRPNAFQKSHSPCRRPFYQQTTLKNINLNDKVNTAEINSVNTAKGNRVTSAIGEQGINVVKSSACWVWRPKMIVLDHVSKNNGSYISKQFDYVDPTGRHKSVMTWISKRNKFSCEQYAKCFGLCFFVLNILQCWLYTTQQIVINSPCLIDKKELAIPRQTATGKEFSNPLMVDSLPKTILPTKFVGCLEVIFGKKWEKNDLEEMDLKWQLTLLSMRERKYYQRTGKKITINGSDTAGYDKSKVEFFNCHKMGHFARECRGPRNQESRARNKDSSRRTMNVEETASKAMVAIDGAGFDWSYMADEEVLTNLDLMALSDSEAHNNKTCSNTCLKSFESLKTQLDNLRVEFNKSEFNLATYKGGLASVEEQLVFYKKNEIEKLKKEKESNQIKIDNFENASKSLDKLTGSQISNNNREGVGYNAVLPPPTGLFAPPIINLFNSGLEEFQQPKFEGYRFKANKGVCEISSNEIKKTTDALIIEDWVSDCDE
ncbi:ribonuclease H-like domain-containing protein, partial [Tanacetum coccineum]